MTLEVTTSDCSAVSDADLAEMADLTAGTVDWEVGELGKQAEEWVLASTAMKDGKLRGFVFSTLERIGGTPAMVLGLAATARDRSSSTTMRALMSEQYHRALMAFPDEDVLVSVRVIDQGGLDVLEKLTDVRPANGVRVNGEERAWGRRLSKRYGAIDFDDRTMLARGEGRALAADHAPVGRSKAADASDALAACKPADGDFVIAWGWAMAEFLESYR